MNEMKQWLSTMIVAHEDHANVTPRDDKRD